MHAYMVLASDPQSYAEAEGNFYWDIAMDEEYNSLIQNNTWDLVLLPPNRKLVRCKWIYITKKETDLLQAFISRERRENKRPNFHSIINK